MMVLPRRRYFVPQAKTEHLGDKLLVISDRGEELESTCWMGIDDDDETRLERG